MISNDEAFIKADVAARAKEEEIGREMSSEEYEKFVIHFMNRLHNPYLYDGDFDSN